MVEGVRVAATTVAQVVTEAVQSHPLITGAASIASTTVALMQSAQQVAGTLAALVTSITGVVLAIMALRGAFKKKD